MTERSEKKLKTYSMLQTGRRLPSNYELVSSRLHYHYPHNFELSNENPVSKWYYQYRESSPLQAHDWEAFADPRSTTYRGYNELQNDKETVVDGLLREIDESNYDDELAAEWVTFLHRWYGAWRFPVHGLEMISAYVGQMAPVSRITNAGAFQSADEMRRIQRIAYRSAQLNARRGGCEPGEQKAFWEDGEPFQAVRELIERALIAYDWGEAFTVLNLVIKPHLDRLLNEELAGVLAATNGDTMLREIHFSLNEDALWHREWSRELARVAIADTPVNADRFAAWVDEWRPRAVAAVESYVSVFEQAPVRVDANGVFARITAAAEEDVKAALATPVG